MRKKWADNALAEQLMKKLSATAEGILMAGSKAISYKPRSQRKVTVKYKGAHNGETVKWSGKGVCQQL